MNRTSRTITVLICSAILLSGCGHITTKSEAKRLAKLNAGQCSLISVVQSSEDSIIYTFEDNELGFQFTVSSVMTAVGMDGSIFYYAPYTTCDYSEEYLSYVLGTVPELSEKYNISIDEDTYNQNIRDYFMTVFAPITEEDLSDIAKILMDADVKNQWDNLELNVSSENLDGIYYCKDGTFKSNEELAFEWLEQYASRTYGNVEYIKKETVLANTVPEIVETCSHYVDCNPEGNAELYYFKDTDIGFEFYISDYYIYGETYLCSNYLTVFHDAVAVDVDSIEKEYNVSFDFSDEPYSITVTGSDVTEAEKELVLLYQCDELKNNHNSFFEYLTFCDEGEWPSFNDVLAQCKEATKYETYIKPTLKNLLRLLFHLQ